MDLSASTRNYQIESFPVWLALLLLTPCTACYEGQTRDADTQRDATTGDAALSDGAIADGAIADGAIADGATTETGTPSTGVGTCSAGGPLAFVSFNAALDSSCVTSPDDARLLPAGLYDISSASNGIDDFCDAAYTAFLVVRNCLEPATSNLLMISAARVHLMTRDGATIRFDRGDNPLPNPFLSEANATVEPSGGALPAGGLVILDLIPIPYAHHLAAFVDDQIRAEVRIFGITVGDQDIEARPFVYPIEICDGCLTVCEQELVEQGLTPAEARGDECPDNAGADGRVCIDSSCE